MKYIGFKIPTENFDHMDWIYDLIEDRGINEAFIIQAKSSEQARQLLFDELYSDEYCRDVVGICLRNLSESYDEDEIIEEYGEQDGSIINVILDEMFDWSNGQQDNYSLNDERFDMLSIQTVRKLFYTDVESDLGIIKVKKEL